MYSILPSCAHLRPSAAKFLSFLCLTSTLLSAETWTSIVPTSEKQAQLWKYTFTKPSDNWFKPDFDETGWKEGPGGFGTHRVRADVERTPWITGDIWIRRTFILTNSSLDNLHLRINHDEDIQIYFNGILAAQAAGYTADYMTIAVGDEGKSALRNGTNSMAIHCHQTIGGQYIDAGLVVGEESISEDPKLKAKIQKLPPVLFVVQERFNNPDGVVRYHSRHIVGKWGCSIQLLDPSTPAGKPRRLYDNPRAAIFDLNLSLDAKTVFFTMREGYEDNWHIYEMGLDGKNLKQVTTGKYHDFAPEELPDGKLVFASSRIKSFNICAQELSTGLFSVNRDGTGYRQLTINTLNDMSPHVMQDGQIMYTRWEYVDRDVKWRQSLWTINPDGSSVQLYFGNTIRDPAVFWQARPLPDGDGVVATFAPHHGWPIGAIGTVTKKFGTEAKRGLGFQWITQEYPSIFDNGNLTEWGYRDPYPVTPSQFLVAYGGGLKGKDRRFEIYLLDDRDRKVLVWDDGILSCTYPIPVSPRKRPPVHHNTEWPAGVTTGTLLVLDVYNGLSNTVAKGEIKALRIMEQVPKFPENETEFPRNRVYQACPVMGQKSYYIKRCLGTVPVEDDGSAHFTVPVFRELYLQALDSEGRAVQSMGSAVNLVPGEKQTCVGCHENRMTAPKNAKQPLAAMKPAATPTPYAWGNNGNIDFTTIVQPVLDKHCAECHSGVKAKGGFDLSGDKTRFFNMAYDSIFKRALVSTVELTANDSQVIPPKKAFAYASRLRDFIEAGDKDHRKVILSKEERERIYVWMDSNCNYYGTYKRTRPNTPGDRDLWSGDWFKKSFMTTFNANCSSCHKQGPASYAINFTRPTESLALVSHLSKESGGLGKAGEIKGIKAPVFASTNDTTYLSLLTAIQEGRKDMFANPRMDMEGAVPKSGPSDWGKWPGTGDPDEKAPGKFWDMANP